MFNVPAFLDSLQYMAKGMTLSLIHILYLGDFGRRRLAVS